MHMLAQSKTIIHAVTNLVSSSERRDNCSWTATNHTRAKLNLYGVKMFLNSSEDTRQAGYCQCIPLFRLTSKGADKRDSKTILRTRSRPKQKASMQSRWILAVFVDDKLQDVVNLRLPCFSIGCENTTSSNHFDAMTRAQTKTAR